LKKYNSIDDFRFQGENRFDWSLFLTVILLITSGLISIYSATYGSSTSGNFTKQILATGLGLVVMLTVTFIPKDYIKLFSYPVYVISVMLLIAVLFIGTDVYGTRGWIRLGGFNLQPSEFAKLGILMALSLYLSRKGSDIRTWRDFGFSFSLLILPIYLIAKQPDIGSASVLLIMFLGVLFWTGFDAFILYFIISIPFLIILSLNGLTSMIVSCSVFSVIAIFFRKKIWMTSLAIILFIVVGSGAPKVYENLAPHQKKRIDTFLDPSSDRLGAGYNVLQSVMAVGSGGVAGKGYLSGSQTQLRYIPMQWTDFIYSVPAEEFGFIGSVFIVLLFLYLLSRILSIAHEADDKYYSILASGTLFILLYHILINIGMVIGVMPVMGIPLPFMSYGGTSMLFNCTLVGLMLNAYRTQRISSSS
jgi:rod shape determining protein RodA